MRRLHFFKCVSGINVPLERNGDIRFHCAIPDNRHLQIALCLRRLLALGGEGSSDAARTAEKVGVVGGLGCFPEKVNPAKKRKTEPRAFLLGQSTYS